MSGDAMTGPSTFAHPRLQELHTLLAERRADLGEAVARVPEALRDRRPAPERWSTAEVLEHLVAMDGAMRTMFAGAIAELQAAGARETDASSVLGRLDVERLRDRRRTLEAPPRVQPRGQLDAAGAWTALARTRAELLDVLATGDGLALGAVTRPHPFFGPLDLYQWALIVAGHETRHADQIREIAATWEAAPPRAEPT